MKYWEVYKTCFKLALEKEMMYKKEFFLWVLNHTVFSLGKTVFFLIIYGVSSGFPGWSLASVLLLSGYLGVIGGISTLLFASINITTLERIRNGTFDIILLSPVNSLFYTMSRGIVLGGLGGILGGFAVMAYSYYLSPLSMYEILYLLLYIPIALALYFAVRVLIATVVIRIIDAGRLQEILMNLKNYASYPPQIFSKSLQLVFITLIPLFSVAAAPIGVIQGILQSYFIVSAIFAVVWAVSAVILWNRTLQHYTSAGG